MIDWTLAARVEMEEGQADIQTAPVEGGYIGRALLPGWPPLEDPTFVSQSPRAAAEHVMALIGELADDARHH
ncbi:hypothetical protein V8Z80_01280 [Orrella sp. JC864]|uniref:hypothetical protein n=1 Tax=Orrella sp. JC864 TaxID=3120298 RepID=UPI0012BB7F01